MTTMRLIAVSLLLCTAACAPVKPWERGVLAEPAMQPSADPMDDYVNEHVFFSKEAATGGRGVGGAAVAAISARLRRAVCGLLRRPRPGAWLLSGCALAPAAGAEAIDNEWVFDAAFLSYKEADDRVAVEKFVIDVAGNLSERDNVDLKVVFDTMTGATPTGAVETSNVVSVTGTSGAGGFTAGGQATALAPFEDNRLAVNVAWTREHSRRWRSQFGASVSVESDYTSMGGSYTWLLDTADKLHTFSLGLGFAHDQISQTGGQTPAPLSDVNDQRFLERGERNTFEFLAGLTSVLGKRTVWVNNLWWNGSDGYHSDPYKVVSVANSDDVEFVRLYEKRPEKRRRKVFYSELIQRFGQAQTMHLSYRYYTDDWAVESHTMELTYRFGLARGQYVEPLLRVYRQSAADFFVRSIPVADYQAGRLPDYASADNRLDDVQGGAVGIKFGKPVGENGEVRFRLMGIGWQAENAVIDQTRAVLLQMSFRKGFF
ncbi:MAG: hypothetical protein KatS3mg121_0176 [Gammaproteobacteria bacterium]|nr:MAG: hypothetical protein KatS3mg121_0176 [Gammaproteobacteria bacterium]